MLHDGGIRIGGSLGAAVTTSLLVGYTVLFLVVAAVTMRRRDLA